MAASMWGTNWLQYGSIWGPPARLTSALSIRAEANCLGRNWLQYASLSIPPVTGASWRALWCGTNWRQYGSASGPVGIVWACAADTNDTNPVNAIAIVISLKLIFMA